MPPNPTPHQPSVAEPMTEERCRILIMPRSHHMDEERCCRVHGVTWQLRWHRKPRVESDVEPTECPAAIADRLRAENASPEGIAAIIAKLTDDERRHVNAALMSTGRVVMDSSARAGYDELADRVRVLEDENARLTSELATSERYAADLESAGIGDLLRKGQQPSDVANAARLSMENEVLRKENATLRCCERCGFSYGHSLNSGCRPGNCSQRPLPALRPWRTEDGGYRLDGVAPNPPAVKEPELSPGAEVEYSDGEMIQSLRGTVSEARLTELVIVDSGGREWRLTGDDLRRGKLRVTNAAPPLEPLPDHVGRPELLAVPKPAQDPERRGGHYLDSMVEPIHVPGCDCSEHGCPNQPPVGRLVPRYPDSVPDAGAGAASESGPVIASVDLGLSTPGVTHWRMLDGEPLVDAYHRAAKGWQAALADRDAALHRAEELQASVNNADAEWDALIDAIHDPVYDACITKRRGSTTEQVGYLIAEHKELRTRLSELEAREAPERAWEKGWHRGVSDEIGYQQRSRNAVLAPSVPPYVAPEKAGGAG